MNEIEISMDRSRLDLAYIHGFLTASCWAGGIPCSLVEESIKDSLSFGRYKDGKQIGFGRVITDYATVAYLADVFVDAAGRGKGYVKRLVDAMVRREQLGYVRRWHLITTDAQPFYGKCGLTVPSDPVRRMERKRRMPYGRNN